MLWCVLGYIIVGIVVATILCVAMKEYEVNWVVIGMLLLWLIVLIVIICHAMYEHTKKLLQIWMNFIKSKIK